MLRLAKGIPAAIRPVNLHRNRFTVTEILVFARWGCSGPISEMSDWREPLAHDAASPNCSTFQSLPALYILNRNRASRRDQRPKSNCAYYRGIPAGFQFLDFAVLEVFGSPRNVILELRQLPGVCPDTVRLFVYKQYFNQ